MSPRRERTLLLSLGTQDGMGRAVTHKLGRMIARQSGLDLVFCFIVVVIFHVQIASCFNNR